MSSSASDSQRTISSDLQSGGSVSSRSSESGSDSSPNTQIPLAMIAVPRSEVESPIEQTGDDQVTIAVAGSPIEGSEASTHRTTVHFSEIKSTLRRVDLVEIRAKYNVPAEFEMIAPRSEERMHRPPPGCLAIPAAALHSGLRFPIAAPVSRILTRIGVCPTQLVPNAFSLIYSFVVVMKCLGQPPTFGNFCELFSCQCSAKSGSTTNPGYYYITARPGKKFIVAPTSSYGKYWKSRWFFIKPMMGDAFGVPSEWCREKVDLRHWVSPSWGTGFVEDLLAMGPFSAADLCEEKVLVRAGLSISEIEDTNDIVLGIFRCHSNSGFLFIGSLHSYY